MPGGSLGGLEASTPRIELLGPVAARVGGKQVDLGGAKPRLLLTLLGLHVDQVVSIEHLIDGLWGEEPPATARKALQVHVSSLRRALGEGTIRTERRGYQLAADVDVARFEELIGRAGRRLQETPETAIDEIEGALALWRDDPFSDLVDEPALVAERTRLSELRLRAIEQQIEALLTLGRHQEVLGDLETLTREHPYREGLRALHMLALYRAGRQADALRAFQRTRDVLAEDLGIDPSVELRELEERILTQDPTLSAPAVPKLTISTLPARRSDLVGRETDIEAVLGLLAGSRLVTLTGVGGSGKTSLAIEVGHRSTPHYSGGVFFVDLTRISDDDDVLSAVFTGIGLPVTSSESAAELVAYLRNRRSLVVLDNCEHVLDGAADVCDLLVGSCPDLSILATSREAISVAGEVSWRVPSLDVGGAGSPAVELFSRRATDADASFVMSDEDLADVIEICERLDGIPLAIELAAARTRTMTVGEIRGFLHDRFRLLSGGRRRAAQRQQTLHGAVEWSYGLLNDDEKAMLRRLAVFQGGFDLADVPGVTGFEDLEAADLVDSLVSKSLVDVIREQGSIRRRRLLETIRLFAIDRLISEGEAEATRERHYKVFAGALAGKSAWDMETTPVLRERSEQELDNFLGAIEWARDTGREADAALIAARINAPLFWAGLLPKYHDLLTADYELAPAEEALVLVGRTALLHTSEQRAEVAREISARARELDSKGPLPDLLFSRLAEYDFAPVEGAAERLAILDDMLAMAGDGASGFYLAEIEARRAGQLFSLARLDETLDASRRAFEFGLAEAATSVYWSATAAIALLIVMDRRDEAYEVLNRFRARADIGLISGFFGYPIVDMLTALAAVGGGDPHTAAKTLAESAVRGSRGPTLDEGDYLVLFAAFRHEAGYSDRANELLELAPVRNGQLNWLIWPYVWEWDADEFGPRNEERRLWELERLSVADDLRGDLPRLLNEEIEFWTGQ